MMLKCSTWNLSRLVLLASVCLFLSVSAFGQSLPAVNKIVVVFEENTSYDQLMKAKNAQYIHALAAKGVLFTQAYGIGNPSQPNYVAFFSGSPAGVREDDCEKKRIHRENLGSLLVAKFGPTGFTTYSEDLPVAGYMGCSAKGLYARKHNPMANWQGTGFPGALPATLNQPFTSFPKDFASLPTVSFVIPNIKNDMHDGSSREAAIAAGSQWLEKHLEPYVAWASQNNSLLIVTWDEHARKTSNHIPLIFVGPMVQAGLQFNGRVDHYDVLRTILDLYGLQAIGEARNRKPISAVWASNGPNLPPKQRDEVVFSRASTSPF